MCLKFKEEIINPSAQVSLINDDYGISFDLSLFASNIKREVCGVLDSFLSFFKEFENRKAHNMLFFMKPLSSMFLCWPKRRCKYCG
jgi:hypothetical protein